MLRGLQILTSPLVTGAESLPNPDMEVCDVPQFQLGCREIEQNISIALSSGFEFVLVSDCLHYPWFQVWIFSSAIQVF